MKIMETMDLKMDLSFFIFLFRLFSVSTFYIYIKMYNNLKHSTPKDILRVIHWNCRAFTQQRRGEFASFLKEKSPDIISLQEVKLTETEANGFLVFEGYQTIYKPRKSNPKLGGGIALLIRDGIDFEELTIFDSFHQDSHELISIKVIFSNFSFNLLSL